MAKFNPNSQDFINLEKRWHEIFKRVGNGTLDPKSTYDALQLIIEGKFPLVFDPFFKYVHLLLSLDQQLALLRKYNEKYWNGAIPEDMFAAVNTTSDHVQQIEDLEILYVQFGSDKQTFENWVAVIKDKQPNVWFDDSLGNGYDIRRLGTNTHQYTFGIYRVHINLAAYWEPKKGRSVDNVRQQVKGTTEQLAHAEVFAAYALHIELFLQADGRNLPWFDAAGYEVKASGSDRWQNAPYGRWDTFARSANVDSYRIDDLSQSYATPVVWKL